MRNHIQKNRGFSLAELLIVVSIFLIITTIVLFNQNKFSSDISISNVSYEVALKIRQAQLYGILVRKSDDGGSSDFDSAYGIHFYKDGGDINFLTFADNPDGDPLVYDVTDEVVGRHALAEGNEIKDVCTYTSIGNLGSEECFSASTPLESVDIVFKRPEPAALITDSASGVQKGVVEITVISSLGDKTRTINVFGSGQISVYAN